MSQRLIYKHLDANGFLHRTDDISFFLQMNHEKKKKFLNELYKEDHSEFSYYNNLWKAIKLKQQQRS